MPFTLSHPAIILPFLKSKKTSATALVVGSMSPDFIYFFRLKTDNDISHTFLGILLVGLPLGIIVMFAFHQIVKKPLIENLPAFFQKRLYELKTSNWLSYFRNNVLRILLSFYFGAVTHLFLDSFVHVDGYFVERISFLRQVFFDNNLYEIAQYAISLVGLAIIAGYLCKQPPQSNRIHKISFSFWALSFVLSGVIYIIRFLLGWPITETGKIVASILFSSMLAIGIVSLLFYKREKAA